MRTALAVLFLVSAVASWQPEARADDPPKKAYLLFPIRTQLQKEIFFGPNTPYYLMVHGDSLFDENGRIDASGLDFDQLNDEIFGGLGGGRIRAHLILGKHRPEEAAQRLVNLAILGWALDYGGARHVPTTIEGDFAEDDWKLAVRLTDDARGLYDEKESEDAVGDEAVLVYPVRTALSRLLSSEADCVISFPRPYGPDVTGTVDEKTKARIKELVDSLKLKERKLVRFAIRKPKEGKNQKAVNLFTDKSAAALAGELGFTDHSVAQRYLE